MGGMVAAVAICWGICGIAAAFMHGKPGLWRVTIWLGPVAFLLFRPNA